MVPKIKMNEKSLKWIEHNSPKKLWFMFKPVRNYKEMSKVYDYSYYKDK